MHSNIFVDLLHLVNTSDGLDDDGKMEAKRLIRAAANINGVGEQVEQIERVQFAQKMISEGEAGSVVRTRLMSAFQVSRRTAYRDIADARNLCHVHGTRKASNGACEKKSSITEVVS